MTNPRSRPQCALEKATIRALTKSAQDINWPAKLDVHMGTVGDDVLGRHSTAAQKLLLLMSSVNGVEEKI